MIGLRQKLVLGFGGLLLILLVISTLGVVVLRAISGEGRPVLLRELAKRRIRPGHGRGDRSAERCGPAGHPRRIAAESHRTFIGTNRGWKRHPTLDTQCAAEDHNITLDGEDVAANELTKAWSGHDLNGNAIPGESDREASFNS